MSFDLASWLEQAATKKSRELFTFQSPKNKRIDIGDERYYLPMSLYFKSLTDCFVAGLTGFAKRFARHVADSLRQISRRCFAIELLSSPPMSMLSRYSCLPPIWFQYKFHNPNSVKLMTAAGG